jgi:translocation and assembly module TamA
VGVLAALLTLSSSAHAADPEPGDDVQWWVGRNVASIQVAAPEHGSLPDESLQPLLRVTEGEALDPAALGVDLVTLFQVGAFEAVEADLEPWVTLDAATGNPIPSVIVTYVVYPAPRLSRVRVHATGGVRDQQLIDASGLQRGQLFFAELDGPFVEERLRDYLVSEGYADGRVQVRTTEPTLGEVYLALDVDAGAPVELDEVKFAGAGLEEAVPEQRLRRWVRRKGVAPGKPLPPTAITDGQAAIREALGKLRGGPFGQRHAWVSARVSWLNVDPTSLTYTIELGPRLEVEVEGFGRGGSRLVEQTLGIDHRVRLTRGFVDQAPERLRATLQERGWFDAQVSVRRVQVDADHDRLVVVGERGPRHTLGDEPPDFAVTFTDAEDPREAAREQSELQALFDQASPDVLRRDFYTEEEMRRGLAAAEQLYLDRGYLSVQLELLEPKTEPRSSPANLVRQILGRPVAVTLTPQVQVTHGPLTTLASLEVTGAPAELDLSALDEELAARVGGPYSPQATDALARKVVEAARAIGYLEADARVQTAPADGENTLRAVIAVDPGEQILLRSIVIRGSNHSRPYFITNLLDLKRGEPLPSTDIERARATLYALGTFRTVSLDLVGDEQARDLVVRLDEAARYEFEPRFGFSTDQGIRAAGQFTRRNLFGLAHSLDLFGQIGYGYRSADVRDWVPDWRQPEWRGAIRYAAPSFPAPTQRFEVDLVLRERRQERTWMMDRTGGGLALETHLGPTTVRLGGRVEARRLGEVDADALIAGEPWDLILDQANDVMPSPWRWQESVTALVLHDLPNSDAVVSLNAEYVPGFDWTLLGADQPRTAYLKSEARFSFYVPLSGLVFRVAGNGGWIGSFGGVVPLEDRFRLGGTGSLRGFVRDAVGPHNVVRSSGVQFPAEIAPLVAYATRNGVEPWTPTGGDAKAALTTELLIPFPVLGLTSWDGYAAELFADAGNVWLVDRDATADSETPEIAALIPPIRLGFGGGIRFDTPLGPLQADAALNPWSAFASGERKVLLRDGWREPPFRLHLTLGALF